MNLVRLQYGGGSSIEPYIVNVTCATSMVGKTVTMTQGSTVLSKICPSSLEVTFKPMNDGLWTVECEGSTKDVTLLAWGIYNVSISWDLSEWLETIGKTTTETSLLAYLNDVNNQADIRELMTRHISADYLYDWYTNIPSVLDDVMASTYGAKWLGLRDYVCDKFMANETAKSTMLNSDNWEYILKDRVPIMTAVNAPYGNIFGSAIESTYYLYNAFDNNSATYYAPSSTASGTYLGYEFTNPTCIQKFRVVQYSGIRCTLIQLCGSNISSNLADMTNIGSAQVVDTLDKTLTIENTQYYKYYCVKFVTLSDRPVISTLQFYGRSLNVSVPAMTSDTEPWGKVEVDSVDGTSYYGYKAFDKNDTTGWCDAKGDAGTESWIKYTFNKPINLRQISCSVGNPVGYRETNQKGTLEVYINGEWKIIESDILFFPKNENYRNVFNVDMKNVSSVRFRGNRVYDTYGNYWAMFKELNFYGLDYSEREFEEGSIMKYLYDHGVELQNIEIVASSSQAEKLPYCLYQHSSTKTDVGFISPLLDMINYKLMRTVFGDTVTTNSYMSVCDTPTGGATAYKYTNIDLPYNHYLDISNITYNGYARIGIENTGNAVKVTEWWLE